MWEEDMREIKFRAKALDGIWFYWKLLDPIDMEKLAIDTKTLGQYTGLKDRNKKEVYSGDILEFPLEEMKIVIRWDISHGGWQFDCYDDGIDDGVGRGNWDFTIGIAKNSEIIGNIYKNNK